MLSNMLKVTQPGPGRAGWALRLFGHGREMGYVGLEGLRSLVREAEWMMKPHV